MEKLVYPLYADVVNQTWVGDQKYVDENGIDTIGLLKVTEIKFGTISDTASVPYEEENVAEDISDDDASRAKNDPVRQAIRTTWPVISVFYEYNGVSGCVARNLELYLTKMNVQDDEAGNPCNTALTINTDLMPITDELVDYVMGTLLNIILHQVQSDYYSKAEKRFIESFLSEANKVFGNLV